MNYKETYIYTGCKDMRDITIFITLITLYSISSIFTVRSTHLNNSLIIHSTCTLHIVILLYTCSTLTVQILLPLYYTQYINSTQLTSQYLSNLHSTLTVHSAHLSKCLLNV